MISKQAFYDWLETAGKRVGVPILGLSSLSLLIAFISLCIGIANYRFQRDASRPVMAASNNLLQGYPTATITFYWANVGQKTGMRGSAVLYPIGNDDDQRGRKMGESPISGAGATLLVGAGANTKFTVLPRELEKSAKYLVCLTYRDMDGTAYLQTFLFRFVADRVDSPFQEIPTEESKANCPESTK
jgi:hypothetical protein